MRSQRSSHVAILYAYGEYCQITYTIATNSLARSLHRYGGCWEIDINHGSKRMRLLNTCVSAASASFRGCPSQYRYPQYPRGATPSSTARADRGRTSWPRLDRSLDIPWEHRPA